GRERLRQALARAAEAEARGYPRNRSNSGAPRSKALIGAGIRAYRQSDYGAARAFHEENLALCRASGNRAGIAFSLNNLGLVAYRQGEYGAARSLQEESLAIKRELGDRQGIAYTLNNLGNVA